LGRGESGGEGKLEGDEERDEHTYNNDTLCDAFSGKSPKSSDTYMSFIADFRSTKPLFAGVEWRRSDKFGM